VWQGCIHSSPGIEPARFLARAWKILPDLDANANAIAIEHIKLENEGWERDEEVPEPSEPSLP